MTWWRYWFETMQFEKMPSRYRIFLARLIIPCSSKYRPPKARNDNAPSS